MSVSVLEVRAAVPEESLSLLLVLSFPFLFVFSLGGCLDAGEGLFFDVVVSDLLMGEGVVLVGLGFDVLLKKSVI